MAYRTKEQMEEETRLCKSLDIADVARYMGYSIFKKGNSTSYTFVKEREGLVLFNKTHTFKDFYSNVSGTVIDFVMHEKNMSFRDAVNFLLQYAGISNDQRVYRTEQVIDSYKKENSAKETPFVLPEKNDNYRRVYAYLTKSRMIDYDTVTSFVKSGLLYEEKEHHNAVFVARDKDGVARHAFLRGTLTDPNRRFRGDVSGSDKKYGFAREGSKDNELLVAFEAPIDLMSFVSLTKDKDTHLLALGMLDSAPIYKYIEEHPGVTDVGFVLDADEPGVKAMAKFYNEIQENGFFIRSVNVWDLLVENGVKDVNEFLVKKRSISQPEIKGKSI